MLMFDMLKKYRERFANWFYVIISMMFKNYPINCILHSGETIVVFNHNQLEMAKAGLIFKFNPSDNKINFTYKNTSVSFVDADYNGDLIGVFLNEEYGDLEVQDKIVVDIGANIGDSAIYFALKGAKKVIAIEPYPLTFKSLKENVNFNGYTNIIKIINGGYGKDSYLVVDPMKRAIGSSSLIESSSGQTISIFSLQTIVKDYDIKDGILKMDCEGCEYELFNENNKPFFNKFEKILLEYHNYSDPLLNFLTDLGFSIVQNFGGKQGVLKAEKKKNFKIKP